MGIYALKPVKKHPVLLFLLCVAVAGVVEYLVGYVGIHAFGLLLNLGGIICCRSVVSFGILGLVFHYLRGPVGEMLYHRMQERTVLSACGIVLTLFAADCVLSFLFRTPITY